MARKFSFGVPSKKTAGPGDGRGITIRRMSDGNTDTIISFGIDSAVQLSGATFVGSKANDFSVSTFGVITYIGPSGRQTNVRAMASIATDSASQSGEVGLLLGVNGVKDADSAQYVTGSNVWLGQAVSELMIPSLQENDTIELYSFLVSQQGLQSPLVKVTTSQVLAIVS